MNKELPKVYEPNKYEDRIYQKWEKSGYFQPEAGQPLADNQKKQKTFSIALPPPNRTGTLHIGHALMLVIQDILIRYHRMKGEKTLWVPGTDHAAIATQSVVEKKLYAEEKKTRHDLGREQFLKRVYDFADKSHKTITQQVKKMGSSLDWSREAYTLDEIRTKTVKTVFKMMYDDGLIYRGDRVVNWCPRCHSTLADDEVEYKKEKGKFYWIKYGPFVLATARPETKLGDTAVAVHPKDERYKQMIGKKYMIPGVLGEFEITVIADRSVDPDFGSGAIKVTPAHSFIDSEMAEKNGIPMKQIINENGRMMDNCGKYAGLTTKEARKAIVADMEKIGLIDHIDDNYIHNIAVCYRCGEVIEPLPSKQWFINVNKPLRGETRKHENTRPPRLREQVGQAKTRKHKLDIEGKTLKEIAIEVVKSGKIKIIPERFEKNYFHWMENLRDWCISRQIWFGHRMPVWYCHGTCNMKHETVNSKKIKITYFVHGTTVDNEKNIASGHYDVELSKLGIEQSKKLGGLMKEKKFDVIFCSDLKRAVDSAKLAFGNRGIKIIQDKRLRECDYGNLTRKNVKEYKAVMKEKINKSFSNGESYKNVEDRMSEFLEEIKSKYGGKKVAIVAHQGPQLALDVILKGKTWQQAINEDWRKTKAWQPGWKYKSISEEIYVGVEPPRGKGWVQDEDTLDTWFSSGLWTFSTLANNSDQIKIKNGKLVIDSDDFKNFHPTTVMETGYDILFFWVARMIIMTTYAVGDIPFENVYLHGLVRDIKGRKMSKSLGNTIDPLDVCAKYGTDAVRLSLIIGTTPGNDLNLSEEKIAGYRNFTNKLWNISRYILQNTKGTKFPIGNLVPDLNLTLADKWILGKMQKLIKQVSEDLDNYRFSQAGERLRDFTWNDFADWYLEATKFYKSKEKDKILISILENLLKLWHPFMPFITEVIWKKFKNSNLIIVEKWPKKIIDSMEPFKFSGFEQTIEIIQAIRNARMKNKVEPARKIKVIIYAGKYKELIKSQEYLIKSLRTGIQEIEIKNRGEKIKKAIYITVSGIEIYLIGAVDEEKENIRIKKEVENLEKLITRTEKKLSNQQFVKKAPEQIVKQEKDKLVLWQEELKKLKEQLNHLK